MQSAADLLRDFKDCEYDFDFFIIIILILSGSLTGQKNQKTLGNIGLNWSYANLRLLGGVCYV